MATSDVTAETRDQILAELYRQYFLSTERYNCAQLLELGWDKRRLENLLDRMEDDYQIKPIGMGGLYYEITASGIMAAERSHAAPKELKDANNKARIEILSALAELYEEKGSLYGLENSELLERTGLDRVQFDANLLLLEALNYIEAFGNALSKITSNGLDLVDEYRQGVDIAEKFEEISSLTPQTRGPSVTKADR